MKAFRFDHYGTPADVLHLRDVEVPDVGDDGILVRVRAAAINPLDWHLISGVPKVARVQMGLRPRIAGLGADLAGQVEAVGSHVTRFRPGDEVYGIVDMVAGTTVTDLGAVAEYVRVTEDSIRPAPANLTPQQAAAVPVAATTALRGLRDIAAVRPGQQVLVNGASGGVGTFAVQVATALGAEVTGVCSTRNVDLVESLGATHVVDYTRQDPTRLEQQFDVVLDNVGNHSPARWRRRLTPQGVYLASFGRKHRRVLGPMGRMIGIAALNLFASQRLTVLATSWNSEELEALTELIEAGQVVPIIDRTYPLADAPAAMAHLAEGHARGKVVITIEEV